MEQFKTTLQAFDLAIIRAKNYFEDKKRFRTSHFALACEQFYDNYKSRHNKLMKQFNRATAPIQQKRRLEAFRLAMPATTKCDKYEVGEALKTETGQLRYTPDNHVALEAFSFNIELELAPFNDDFEDKEIEINKPTLITDYHEGIEPELLKDLQGFVVEIKNKFKEGEVFTEPVDVEEEKSKAE